MVLLYSTNTNYGPVKSQRTRPPLHTRHSRFEGLECWGRISMVAWKIMARQHGDLSGIGIMKRSGISKS